MKKRALGRGLGSLIPQAPERTPLPAVPSQAPPGAPAAVEMRVDIDRIRPNPKQPRRSFDDAALEELAQSLRAQGVLQPVVVRPAKDGAFELVAGERRWRAAQRAGLHKIPVVVRNVPDDRLLETALIENLQREDLNPIEAAQAYRMLLDDLALTQEQVAERVGKQRATVANTLRLLQLHPTVQERVRRGELSMGHARALVSLGAASDQISVAEQVVSRGLSVRQTESLVARLASGKQSSKSPKTASKDPNVEAAEHALQKALGTKVRILQGAKGGRLEIVFYSPEELERVYQLLLGAARKRS